MASNEGNKGQNSTRHKYEVGPVLAAAVIIILLFLSFCSDILHCCHCVFSSFCNLGTNLLCCMKNNSLHCQAPVHTCMHNSIIHIRFVSSHTKIISMMCAKFSLLNLLAHSHVQYTQPESGHLHIQTAEFAKCQIATEPEMGTRCSGISTQGYTLCGTYIHTSKNASTHEILLSSRYKALQCGPDKENFSNING